MMEHTPVNPDDVVEYNGVSMAIKDVPDPLVRVMLGYGHDIGGRGVIEVPGRKWETTPDKCTYGSFNWEWVTVAVDQGHALSLFQYLVCPKCGLDGT